MEGINLNVRVHRLITNMIDEWTERIMTIAFSQDQMMKAIGSMAYTTSSWTKNFSSVHL